METAMWNIRFFETTVSALHIVDVSAVTTNRYEFFLPFNMDTLKYTKQTVYRPLRQWEMKEEITLEFQIQLVDRVVPFSKSMPLPSRMGEELRKMQWIHAKSVWTDELATQLHAYMLSFIYQDMDLEKVFQALFTEVTNVREDFLVRWQKSLTKLPDWMVRPLANDIFREVPRETKEDFSNPLRGRRTCKLAFSSSKTKITMHLR
jgi:hypothetical protein